MQMSRTEQTSLYFPVCFERASLPSERPLESTSIFSTDEEHNTMQIIDALKTEA